MLFDLVIVTVLVKLLQFNLVIVVVIVTTRSLLRRICTLGLRASAERGREPTAERISKKQIGLETEMNYRGSYG